MEIPSGRETTLPGGGLNNHSYLVGGFNPIEKYAACQIGSFSLSRVESKQYFWNHQIMASQPTPP